MHVLVVGLIAIVAMEGRIPIKHDSIVSHENTLYSLYKWLYSVVTPICIVLFGNDPVYCGVVASLDTL